MDAEIRRLTYVPRFAGAKQGSGASAVVTSLIGELPAFLRKDEPARHSLKPNELRLEARILELERELAESEQRHRAALVVFQQRSDEERTTALSEQAEGLAREWCSSIGAAVASFEEAQAQYFADAEAAVVRLALGIAARVLHREAQMDSLLLRGPVRIALEDAQQGTACVLEVAPQTVGIWERWLSSQGSKASSVQVRTKADASAGHCRLEIGASSADLSVDAQLVEIERGFFDLLGRRTVPRGEAAE